MRDIFSLQGKKAVVIGGTKGLGKEMAKALSQAGAVVVIASRNEQECEEQSKKLQNETEKTVYGIVGDISTCAGARQIICKAEDKLGGIDILVNSAGINIRKPSMDYTEQDWDEVQNVQLKGPFFTCQTAAKVMVENNVKGRIINIASINAKIIARPDIVSYVAAKGAVMQMTKALAVEWAAYGITVNSIAPGFFETEMTKVLFEDKKISRKLLEHIPVGRFGNPMTDLAGIVVYFASDASQYTTGQMICIDGGYTCV